MTYLSKKRKKICDNDNKLTYSIVQQTISDHIKLFKCKNYLPMNLSLENLLTPSRKKMKFNRPPNLFIIYRKYLRSYILSQDKNASVTRISKISSQMWNNETQETKCYFDTLSKIVASAYSELNFQLNDKVPQDNQMNESSLHTFPSRELTSRINYSNNETLDSTIMPYAETICAEELNVNYEELLSYYPSEIHTGFFSDAIINYDNNYLPNVNEFHYESIYFD